jgi:hypothetical protein
MSGRELIDKLAIDCYKPSYRSVRDQSAWPSVKNPLHIAILVIDFDTEVSMNGMLGFLGNSSGAYLEQTTEAFDLIGAKRTADVLRCISKAMIKHGITHQKLRAPAELLSEYQITSFAELHGPELEAFASEVCEIDDALYLYDKEQEMPFPLLDEFVERNAERFVSEMNAVNLIGA